MHDILEEKKVNWCRPHQGNAVRYQNCCQHCFSVTVRCQKDKIHFVPLEAVLCSQMLVKIHFVPLDAVLCSHMSEVQSPPG